MAFLCTAAALGILMIAIAIWIQNRSLEDGEEKHLQLLSRVNWGVAAALIGVVTAALLLKAGA